MTGWRDDHGPTNVGAMVKRPKTVLAENRNFPPELRVGLPQGRSGTSSRSFLTVFVRETRQLQDPTVPSHTTGLGEVEQGRAGRPPRNLFDDI